MTLKNKISATADTQFRVASLSKPITSLALGKLLAGGKVDLDQDIHAYLPVFHRIKYPITTRLLAGSTSYIRH